MHDAAESNKALIRRMFQDVFEKDSFDRNILERYFSPKFIQHADGKTLDFEGLINHVHELKRTVTHLSFSFEHMLAEGNKVMDIHRVDGEKRAGGAVSVRLFSLWVIEDGKIVLCDELSRIEEGAAEDRDLGSRTLPRRS